MTIPSEYQRATVEFECFVVDARDAAGLATTNLDMACDANASWST